MTSSLKLHLKATTGLQNMRSGKTLKLTQNESKAEAYSIPMILAYGNISYVKQPFATLAWNMI